MSKHDKVPHFIQIMNKYFDRLKNTLNTEGVVRSTGVYREGDDVQQVGDSMQLTEDMCLLDPLRNSPLKIYIAAANNMQLVKAKKINVSKFPLRLNQMEKDVNSHTGTVLLLGRSGTGEARPCYIRIAERVLCHKQTKHTVQYSTVQYSTRMHVVLRGVVLPRRLVVIVVLFSIICAIFDFPVKA